MMRLLFCPHKHKSSPEEGMGKFVALDELGLSALKGEIAGRYGENLLVEGLHEHGFRYW
jgi:hypothetical protein